MMKKIFSIILMLTVLFTACTKEKTPIVNQIITINATIVGETKVTLGADDEKKVDWTEGDEIYLNVNTAEYLFTWKGGTTFAYVGATLPTLTPNMVITATYLSDCSRTQTGLKADVGKYMALSAEHIVSSEQNYGDLNLIFSHETSVLKLILSNDDFKGNNVTDIILKSSGSVVANATSTFVGDPNDGSVIAYLVIPPAQLQSVTIHATCNSKEYVATISNREVVSGKLYNARMEVAVPTDYIDEYGINHGPGVEVDGVVWAPVNCGYHELYFKWGKLYQWGRKYGQGYSGVLYEDGGIIGEVSDAYGAELGRETPTLEVGQSESNAHVFYLSSSSTLYDWLNRHNSTYWNSGSESSPIKTEYDPCPAGWRVPTYDELDILSQNTSFWITTDDNQTACIFSGTTPYTNEPVQLIMTAAGYRSGSECTQRGNRGEYWSSGAYGGGNTATVAYSFGLLNGYEPGLIGSDRYRSRGHSVRCVRDQVEEDAPGDDEVPVPISSVNLNQTSLSIYEGDYSILVATVGPEDATDKNVSWSSSDPSVATVVQTGFTTAVTAVSSGSAVISATVGGLSATCVVSVRTSPDYIDEYGVNHGKGIRIGQLVWAPVNCGYHESDYKYGKLYQWGRKDGQGYEGDADVPELHDGRVSVEEGQDELNANVFFMSSSTNYFTWMLSFDETLWNSGTEESPVKTEYDPCPEGWRVPTNRELRTNYTNKSTWTTNEDGQNGYWFSGPNTYGEKVSRVFLSAAGYRNGKGQSLGRGGEGHYMSSYVPDHKPDLLNLSSSGVTNNNSLTALIYGLSVRCVRE